MKPNPKAIKALKRVMTKEQRRVFIELWTRKHSIDEVVNDWKKYDVTLNTLMEVPRIHNSLTEKEKKLKLFIK